MAATLCAVTELSQLTPTEKRVAEMIAAGFSNREAPPRNSEWDPALWPDTSCLRPVHEGGL
jgi:hypothetical protein